MLNKAETEKLDKEYIMGTYGRFDADLVRGTGAAAYDADGKKYIDFTAGIGVNSLGYCNKDWAYAVGKQAGEIQHISNLYYSPVSVTLAQELCEKTGFSRVFFANSGAEANECAIKLARKASFDKYGKERTEIICFENSFHGRTITTLSATGQDVFHNYFFPFTEGFKFAKANDIESVKALIDSKKTCAVMIELIQGEGGVNPMEKGFIKELAALCKEKELNLIVDEVQTGMGRTGKLFCYENYEIKPDIITAAKGLGGGLPIGACLCSEKLKDVMTAGTHGTTYGGNPIACAGALEVMKKIANDEFMEQVRDKGEYIKNYLLKLPNVKGVRGMGLMIGIELDGIDAKKAAVKCTENGLLILTAKTLLRMLPPLTITYGEIDSGLEILKETLERKEELQ